VMGNTITTDITSLALFYAIKSGAFARAGLELEVKSFIQSSQKYDAFKAGALDMDINMGAVNAAQLHSAGVPLVVLRAYTTADIWAIIVKKDSPIQRLEEFKGKKFGAVSLSGINFAVTYFAFKAAGLDVLKDMQLTTLPPAALRAAIEKGDLEGGTTYELHLSEAVKAGGVRILLRPGEMYQRHYGAPFVALVNSARKDFYEKNKQALARFDAVMEKAFADLPAHLDEAAQALVEGGTISAKDALKHPLRSVLWKYLGSKEVGEGPDAPSIEGQLVQERSAAGHLAVAVRDRARTGLGTRVRVSMTHGAHRFAAHRLPGPLHPARQVAYGQQPRLASLDPLRRTDEVRRPHGARLRPRQPRQRPR